MNFLCILECLQLQTHKYGISGNKEGLSEAQIFHEQHLTYHKLDHVSLAAHACLHCRVDYVVAKDVNPVELGTT